MATVTEAAVLDALKAVKDPDLHKDIVTLGFVKQLAIEGERVSFVIELTTPACPVKDLLRDQARAAVAALPGVGHVEIEMTASVRANSRPELGRAPVEGVKNVIAVGAGKGGVGKTTVAVNLAVALASWGSRVALLDGDMYGPNVPIMVGLRAQLETDGKKIVPAERYGLQIVSMGFLTQDDTPVIWRGPMLHGAIQQFFRDVAWKDIDYLIVDMPPGTGDVALSLSQTVPVAGAVRRHDAAGGFARRHAAGRADVSQAQHSGDRPGREHEPLRLSATCLTESDIFGKGGGEQLAKELSVPFLGRIPLDEPVRRGGDTGVPIVVSAPDSPPSRALFALAERVAQQVSIASYSRRAIPLTPVG